VDLIAISDLQLNTTSFACWDRLHEIILDESTTPFVKAHKHEFFDYCTKQDMEYGALLQDAMLGYFHFHKSRLIDDFQQCGILDGVKSLVDVGGGWGATTSEIVSHYRQIQCINFDLPRVIATAPAMQGT
jgi:caffeic acid 3-O-methyltransferase